MGLAGATYLVYISALTLDDLLQNAFRSLLKSRIKVSATRGTATERIGVLLRLRNPRARLSRTEGKGTVFSCLGELLWYLERLSKPLLEYVPADQAAADG